MRDRARRQRLWLDQSALQGRVREVASRLTEPGHKGTLSEISQRAADAVATMGSNAAEVSPPEDEELAIFSSVERVLHATAAELDQLELAANVRPCFMCGGTMHFASPQWVCDKCGHTETPGD